MQSKHDAAAIVFCDDEVYLAPDLINISFDNVLSLAEFSPDGKPAIFVARPEHLATARHVLQQMSATARAQSVITGRMPKEESLPIPQAPSAVFVPLSSEECFAQWLAVLQGKPTPVVSPYWFLLDSFQSKEHVHDLCCIPAPQMTPPYPSQEGNFHDDPRLVLALQELASGDHCQLKLENLARAAHCSMRQLGKLFHERLGITPGLLLRAMVTFAETARLMKEEAQLRNGKRRGQSPLGSQRDDYRRRLQRLLGMTYSELRQAAKQEHWAVVWMRKWRERLRSDV